MEFVVAHLFWDEVLMFVVPVLLVLAAVRWAERRQPPDDSSDPGAGNVTDTAPARPTRREGTE